MSLSESESKTESQANLIIEDNNESRGEWGSTAEFILSCLGCSIGLGNIWRFPYLVGKSGGAAFLIPYVVIMVFAGLPVFYMELSLGQYAATGPLKLFQRICPAFQGVGIAMVCVSVFTSVYYNMIISWALYYMFASFTSQLPWENCKNSWNTDVCFDDRLAYSCQSDSTLYYEGFCRNSSSLNSYQLRRILELNSTKSYKTPASEYLNRRVLGLSEGFDKIGLPRWELVLSLFGSWLLTYLCLVKGIKSSGKVVYFTATFPFVILFILIIRGVTLDGALNGINFYIVPKFADLSRAAVWGDAALQIFFSLGVGSGGLITLASYNKISNNVLRNSLIVTFGDCFTSFFAGFAVFSIVGFIAKQLNMDVSEIASSGPGLAFVAYADAVTRFPGAPFWAILFFFMLIILGIDSELVSVEVIITTIFDMWPNLRKEPYKSMVVGAVCVSLFFAGLILTTPGGPYILQLMDTFASGWPLLLICLIEVLLINIIYGIRRFSNDIKYMLGSPPSLFWKYLGYPINYFWISTWLLSVPILLIFVLVFNWIGHTGLSYDSYKFPAYSEIVGWLCFLSCVAWIPIMLILKVVQAYCSQNKVN